MKLFINIHFPDKHYNPGDIACLIRNISILYGKCEYEINLFNSHHQENKIYKYVLKKCGRTNITKTEEFKKFFKVNILKTQNVYKDKQKISFSNCNSIIILDIVDNNNNYIFDILHYFCQKRSINKNKITNKKIIVYVDNIQYYPNLNNVKNICILYPNILFKIKLSNENFEMRNSQENRTKSMQELMSDVPNTIFIQNLSYELEKDNLKYYLVDLDETAIPCENIIFENNIGLIFGSESNGISKEVYDTVYKINNYSKIFIESKSKNYINQCFSCSSMNLSIAIFSSLSIMFS